MTKLNLLDVKYQGKDYEQFYLDVKSGMTKAALCKRYKLSIPSLERFYIYTLCKKFPETAYPLGCSPGRLSKKTVNRRERGIFISNKHLAQFDANVFEITEEMEEGILTLRPVKLAERKGSGITK